MNLKERCRLLVFKEMGDERGKLVAIESLKDIPFEIKRIIYCSSLNDFTTISSTQANKNAQLVLINLKGMCKISLHDENEELIVELSKPNTGIFIPRFVLKDILELSNNSLLLSLLE